MAGRIVAVLMLICGAAHAEEGVRAAKAPRPNILWITIEDWSPDLSCYGTPGIHTPNVDRLAAEGVRYEWAFTTAPVCSASRSAMMTGFHQNYIHASQHRTATRDKKPLPYGIKPIPHLFRDAGYFTALMSWKVDCNFIPYKREELFEGTDYRDRAEGQPFFARVTFDGTHRIWHRDPENPIDPSEVELPPYYPDNDFCRRDWANGLEQMQVVDREVGALLRRLEDDGLADNTIVIFIADHGRCHIRGKQFLYDGGIRVPMMIRWPGKVKPGTVDEHLVQSIDLCATLLAAAGIEPPVPLHGEDLFGDAVKDRTYIFAARDKMDETHDAMRAVRSKDYKLIHNLMPERPYMQFNRYKEGSYPMLALMNAMYLRGELTPAQARFFAASKPEFELYDLRNDPHEIHNLSDDPEYAGVKSKLLAELNHWREQVIRDEGVSETFRARDVFPKTPPEGSVPEWILAHRDDYDYEVTGWPAYYPTRSLEEWERIVKLWEPWVFRAPDAEVKHPQKEIVWTKP